MLDIVFILLIFLAIILFFYAVSERAIAFTLMDSVLWLILGAILIQGIEVPYEMYNSTSGNIETGVHTITTNLEPISYLCMGIGAVVFILFISFILETLYDVKKVK